VLVGRFRKDLLSIFSSIYSKLREQYSQESAETFEVVHFHSKEYIQATEQVNVRIHEINLNDSI